MKQYQTLEIVKYQHEYETDFSIEMEHQRHLNNVSSVVTQLPSYYRIFQKADRAENRAELTFFVEEMLRILTAGQEKVLGAMQKG